MISSFDSFMVFLKVDKYLQFAESSCIMIQSLMVPGKKQCSKISVVQLGSLSDFVLLICVSLMQSTCD